MMHWWLPNQLCWHLLLIKDTDVSALQRNFGAQHFCVSEGTGKKHWNGWQLMSTDCATRRAAWPWLHLIYVPVASCHIPGAFTSDGLTENFCMALLVDCLTKQLHLEAIDDTSVHVAFAVSWRILLATRAFCNWYFDYLSLEGLIPESVMSCVNLSICCQQ